MDKIAAYEIALEQRELEKRAEYLVETYGTVQGDLPEAYLVAFDELEKEGGLKAIGTTVGKAIGKVKGNKVKVLGMKMKKKTLGGLAVAGGGLAAFGAGRMSKG